MTLVACGIGAENGITVENADEVQRITPSEAKSLIDTGDAVLYDARGVEWYEREHAAGAISLPEADVAARLETLPTDVALIFYCT